MNISVFRTAEELATGPQAGDLLRITRRRVEPAEDGYKVTFELQREAGTAAETPLIDGCRIVHRGDGHYVCQVHLRHWPVGSGICPGRQGR